MNFKKCSNILFFHVTENIKVTPRMYMCEMTHSSKSTVRKEELKNIHVPESNSNEEEINLRYDRKT